MNRIVRLLSFLVLVGGTAVAGASECSSLGSMRWLLGEWLAEGAKSTWRETWTEIGPKTWEGQGIEASKADPTRQSAEDLRLVEMGDSVFYLAKVNHNELPIPFPLVECGDGRLVFANPKHDFPRRLEYERQPDGRLHVRVSDGAEKGFTLDFARQSAPPANPAAVLAAEDSRFAAMVAADPESMQRWFTEDLVYVHSTGVVENRQQLIEGIRDGKLRYLNVAPADRRVSFMGPEVAFVQGLARIQVESGPKRLEFQARYLAVYGLEAGTWRLRAWQSLRLP